MLIVEVTYLSERYQDLYHLLLKPDDDFHRINSLGSELWEDLYAEICWGMLSGSTFFKERKKERGKRETKLSSRQLYLHGCPKLTKRLVFIGPVLTLVDVSCFQKVEKGGRSVYLGKVALFCQVQLLKIAIHKLSADKAYSPWGNVQFSTESRCWSGQYSFTMTSLILRQFSFKTLGTCTILVLKLMLSLENNVFELLIW